ncbi:ataxin-10-like [Daphnia pulex]|uniref:ataxin-10-like n=1 Tax=Daphnia pulex TaxID=6669 RepID=UPI001EE05645|nr:ataxin-10-like [Daphnia pulex]
MSNSSKDSFWTELEFKLKEGLANLNSSPTDHQPILNQLQALTQQTVEDDFRSSIPNEILQLLLKIIQRPVGVPLVLECARILRNCCGKNWESFPDTWNQLLSKCNQLLESFILKEFPVEEIVLARVILQCVGNILNTHTNLSHIIWESFQSNLSKLLSHEDEKISLYSSSVMFGVLRNSLTIREELTNHKWRDLTAELILSSHKGILYSQFAIKLFMCDQNMLENMYNFQEIHTRLLLLHQISEFSPECEDMDVQNWQFFSRLFQERASLILRTCENPSLDLEAMEATSLVEILAKSSSGDVCHRELFLDDDLLVTTIDLLRSIHSLGQSGSNYFTTINDHFGSVEPHPALNFKCNLVRLLGNLSYKNPSAQDRIRELEAIAPLLECCNLDARNPFIQQWSILAIRNLCEKNIANQEVIGSMTRQGVVQPSLLEDLGMVVEESDSGLSVRPCEANRKP